MQHGGAALTEGMPPPLLLVDPDHAAAAQLAAYLCAEGFPTLTLPEPRPLFARLAGPAAAPPRLVLLHRRPDPRCGGLDLLRRIRDVAPVLPCIVLAGHARADEERERILGLEGGADDYVPSSTSPREVLARIRAVLRRAEALAPPVDSQPPGDAPAAPWRLAAEERELYAPDGTACGLTSAEFELLHLLTRARGVPVGREVLFRAVFRRPYRAEDRAVDNLVVRLRRKLERDGTAGTPRPAIKSVRGVGYAFTGLAGGAAAGMPAGCVENRIAT